MTTLKQFTPRDNTGGFRTESLFLERRNDKPYPPVYTMHNEDIGDYPSIKRILMESQDEYEAAMKIVGDMAHWRKLCSCKFFMEGGKTFEGLNAWREDKKNSDLSKIRGILMAKAEKGDVAAAKKLYDETIKACKNPAGAPVNPVKKPLANRGRPLKGTDKSAKPMDENVISLENRITKLHAEAFSD